MSSATVSSAPEPTAGGRLPALDALRAVGAIAVVAHHVGFHTGATGNAQWGGWLARMDVGVAIFFVLSGFLLFRPWALSVAAGRARPGTGRYLRRRALRILPAYWLTVATCLIVLPQNRPAPAADWLRHLTFTQIYGHGLLRNGLSQTWSLATEVAFYLVLPLIAAPAVGRTWRPVRTVLAACGGLLVTAGWLVAMAVGWLDMGLHTTWLPAYGGWFGAGMALAAAHVALRTGTAPAAFRILDDVAAAPVACWAAAIGLLAIATTPVAGPRDLTEPSPAAFAVKLTLYLAVAVLILLPLAFGPPTRIRVALEAAPARWLGAVSYGLFLWHPMMLELIYIVADRPLFTGGLISTFALTMAGGLSYAAVSYYGIERPLQMLGSQRRARRPATPVADRTVPAVPHCTLSTAGPTAIAHGDPQPLV